MLLQGWCYSIFKKFLKDDTQYWNYRNTPVIVQFLKDRFFSFKVFIQILLHSNGMALDLLTKFAISQIHVLVRFLHAYGSSLYACCNKSMFLALKYGFSDYVSNPRKFSEIL